MTDQMPKPTGLSKPTVGNDDFFNQDFSKFGQPEKNLEVSAGDLGVGLAGSAIRGTGTGIAEIGLSDLMRAGAALSDLSPMTMVADWVNKKAHGWSDEQLAAKKKEAIDEITGAVTDPVDNAIIKPIVNPIGTAIKEGGETLIDRGTSEDYKEALRGRELFTGDGVSDFAISDSAGDPAVWAAKFTDGIGSLGGTLAVGALTGGTVKALVKKQMLKRGASMELADETARLAGIKWGQRGAIAEGVNMSTGQSADQARSQVESLSWDQLLTSKTFNDQVKEISRDPRFEGASATELLNEAKRRTADYAASIAKSDPKTWAAAAAGTLLGDAALFKMLQGTGAKGVAAGVLRGMAGEGLGESVEEGTQQYVGNEATNIAGGQNIDPMSGVLQAAATAGTIGVLSGGGVGAIGGARGAYAPQDEQASIAGEQPSDPLQASAVPEFDSALAEVNAIERKTYGQHSIGRDGNKFRGAYVDELGNVQITPAYSKIEDVRAAMGWPVPGQADNTASQPAGRDDFANTPAFQRQDGGRFKGWAEDSDVQRALAGEFGPSVQEIIAAQMQSGDQGKTMQERVLSGELGRDPFAGGKSAIQVGTENAPLRLPQKDIIFAGDANAKQPGTEVAAPGAFDDKQAGPGPQFRGSERTRWQDGQEGDVLPPEAAGNPAGALPGRVIEGEAREVGTELPHKPFIAGQDNRAAVSEEQRRQAEQSAMAERQQNQPKQIGQSDTIFAPGAPGADNKNIAYTPPRLSRDQVDTSLGEQSIRDPRTDAGKAIQQAGSEADSIFGKLNSLRITRKGKPFATQKEAQLASRKTETPIELPTGGFGVVDKAELEQAQASQAPIKQQSSNPAQQDRQDGKTEIAQNGMVIVHGSGNPGMSEQDIQIVRASGQKQGKKGRVYGGFYGTSEQDAHQAQAYADMMGGTPTLYDVKIKPGTKVLHKQGDITRLSESYINELVSQGYGVVTGTDPRGQTEHVVIDKSAVASMAPRGTQSTPSQVDEINVADMRQPSDQPAKNVSADTVPAPSATAGEASQVNHDSNEAPGSDVGNGFKAGPHKGSKYRVSTTNTTGAENGTPILEKRMPGGSAATFYVGKDGNLLDADNVVFNDESSKERVWRPASKEQTAEAASILDEMGKLDLNDPKRAELKVKLKALVLGETTSTIKPSMQAEASQNQSIRQADQTVKSIDHAKQNTAPATDAGVSVSGPPRFTIEPLTDNSIIVKGDKNDAELKEKVEAAWPKAKPLYNERHKGWVFSSKREGVVREALADLLPGDVSEQKAAPVPWSEIQDRNEGTTPDADEAMSLLAAMQYGNKTLNDYVDVKAKSAEIIQQMKGVYDLYAHMDAAMRDAGYEFGKSDRERLMGNYLDMDEMTARDISNMKTKGILSDGKTRVVDVPDGGSMFDAGKLLRNEYSKADVLAVLAKLQNEDFTPRDGWESNLQAAREYANHLRKTGQISEGAALKAWGKLESLVGLITNATAPAGKTVDFSKAKTVKAQLDMWDSLEAGDRVIDVKGIDRGSVFSKMKSRRIVQLTDQFNKRDEFSIAAITGGGSDIVAQLEARHAKAIPSAIAGATTTIYTPKGKPVRVQYRIVEAADLVSSHEFDGTVNRNYPQTLQPRDRSKGTYQVQVRQIANNPEGERLGASPETDRGAPIVREGIVESGNGRTIGIKQAYNNGTAGDYRAYLEDHAAEFGLDPAEVEAMQQPVLVRERLTEMDDAARRDFVVDSNTDAKMANSASEDAKADAGRLDDRLLGMLNIPEGGDLLAASNEPFLNAFARAIGDNSLNQYKDDSGRWNDAYRRRVANAIFAYGYGSDALLKAATGDTDSTGKNITSSLMNNAAKMAELRNAAPEHAGDLVNIMAEAIGLMNDARRNGQSLQEVINQGDMLSGGVSHEGGALAEMLSDASRSAKRLTETVGAVLDMLNESARNSGHIDMLTGEPATTITAQESINAKEREYRIRKEREQQALRPSGDLFGLTGARDDNRQDAGVPGSAVQGQEQSGAGGLTGKPESKLDKAAQAIKDKKREKAEKLKRLLQERKGTLNAGIDPEVMIAVAELGALSVADGAVRFAQFVRDTLASTRDVGIDDADVKPFLKEAYGAIASNPEKYGVSDEVADQMDLPRDVRRANLDEIVSNEQREDSQPKAKPEDEAKKLRTKLRERLYLDLSSGIEIANNNDLKKAAANALGIKPADVTPLQLKEAQEAYEVAAANVRREQIQKRLNAHNGQRAAFDYAVDEYGKQPNLDVRTASSSDLQAYSTPAPMALLANLGAGIHAGTSVYEPTAGNGLLLLTGDQSNTYANELDPDRADSLAWSGFNVTILDATNSPFEGAIPGQVDAVVANPPFGKLRDANGKPTKITFEDPQGRAHSFGELDHVIAKNALDAMKDDGKATLILGAPKEAGDYTGNNKAFLNWLYSNYNVVHHIEVDGDLYKGQGAGWPTQMIVIHGRETHGTGKFAPFKGEVKRLDNWSDIYDSFNGIMDTKGNNYSARPGHGNVLPAYQPGAESMAGEGGRGGHADRPDRGSSGVGKNGSGRNAGSRNGKRGVTGKAARGSFDSQPDIGQGGLGKTEASAATTEGGGATAAATDGVGLPGQRNDHAISRKQFKPKAIVGKVNKANEFQAYYQTASNGFNDAVLTPVNMASYTQTALAGITERHGSVDGYVADRLGYKNPEQLHKAFMGLQADAVAMAVDAIERDRAIIIGDQTGVGKGRQAAGVIRYALQQGMTPIFITQKPNLFTDMYDDLVDIGVEGFKPLIMNQDNGFVSKGDDKLFDLSASSRRLMLERTAIDGKLPEGYNGLFLTYSQISSDKNGAKLNVLNRLAGNAILVMDESHTASGGDSKLGKAFQGLVTDAKGVVYLSATYAKRPDNMQLYTRTDMGQAVENKSELVSIIQGGGIGMQTYIAGKLSEAGQMVRRERSFDGISITNRVLPDKNGDVARQFDDVTEALRAIQDMSSAWRDYVESDIAKKIQIESGMDTLIAGNQADTKVNVTLFSSVIHNYIAQLSLGLKAKQTAQLAIESIKQGKRPVIALENTMGAALESYMERSFKRIGDTADDLTYGNLLKSIADGVLAYRVKEPGSTESRRVLVPIDNVDSPYIKMMYNRVMDLADNLNVDVPASPIDAIRHELTRAGYSVAEITGRSELVDYGNNSTISRRPADELDRRSVVDRFNSGKLDVLILNQAGSTGLSIHASERFDDQNQRHMIVAQPSLDINTFMQMLGRVNRTGQVKKPTYDLAWLDLPSEMRPAAVLSRKMTSLNANTSGNTDSATSIESVDLLNVYGDQVVTDYVKENYDQLAQYSSRLVQLPDEDAAVYFLGKLAVMPVKVQKQVLEQLEENYRNLIEYLDATGQNELNMTEMDLDAKPVEQLRVSEGRAGAGVFSEPTYVTKVDVKAQGKAPTWDEVKAELEQSGQAEFDEAVSRMMDDTAYEARLKERLYRLEKEIDTLSAEGKKTDVAMDDKLKIEGQLSSFADAKMEIASKFGRGGMFAHGSVVRVKLPENETAVTGVVVSVKYSHGSGNPASQSKWKVGIMLADRVRKLPLALTQADQMIEGTRRESEDGLKSIFDRAASLPAREHRYIMTGNLIEAQSRSAEKGRIVPFTTNDGRVIQGMLMPKKFKPESSLRDKVSVTPDQAFGWLANTNDGVLASLGLTTNDGEVTLRRERWGSQFTLEMPKAVSKGKKYWGNPRMVEIIGEQAVKGNGKLEIKLSMEDARRVTSVMDVINPLGIYNQAQISDFNQMTGKNVPTFQKDSIKFSLSKHSDAAPGTRGMTKPELEMVATDWSKQYKGAANARIMVAANKAEMNELLGMVGAEVPDGQTVNAAYLPGYKTLLLNAEAIQSPKRARELMRHELLAHHGLREVVGDDAYISIIEAVKRGKDISGIKDAYYQVAQNYTDMHPDVQAEEVFAHWMEKQPDRGELAIWWRGIVRRVKDALRAVGLVGERTTEEEFNRVLDAIATGMRNGRKPGRRVMESWHDAPAYSKNDALFSLGAATADQSIIGKAESLAKAAPSSVLNWIKEQRGVGLGTLTDLQIDQIYRGVTGGAVSRYQKLRANMEADRNDILLDAETRIDPLWDALGKEQKKALSNLMHDATMARLHPDQSLADNSLYQEVKQKLDRATKPSTKAEYQAELDTIIANHKHLAERYNLGLNKEGKALYKTMRETYDKQWADLRDAIEQRLEDMMGAEGKTLAAELRLQMEHALKHGPYFPLARFGDYVVKASKGDEHIREHFERRKDAEQAIKQYQRDGYNAVMTVKEEGNGGQANSNALGMKVMQLLDEADSKGGSASSIKDDVWQAMLQMLPDASFAKHAIHRRRVKGASRDGHRAYLNSVYHYAHHVSKIRYGHQMQAELNKMNEQIQAGVRGEESNIKPEDLEVAQQVLNEMNKRHELNMNPKGAKWTGWAGNLGFMWYMAGSPASAIINMTQNFTVMLPQLGAKYGFVKASAAMAKAMHDYAKHGKFKAGTKEAWVSLTRADSGITSDEKALLNSLYKAGALDLTQAHSVAARADTDLQDVKPGAAWKRKTMAWLGSMFHNAEVLNREVAALAAYRLLKEQSPNLTAEQYADQVTEMVYDGHGNYAASNRPRYMRGDVAKVLTQFKIYSQMMTYTIYRNAYLAAKGDKVALKTLGGVLGTHFIMAGVMGLPFPITAALYAIAAAADDDDDRTGKASFRIGLAETLGTDLGELVARGPMDAVTGLSIAGRTGINDLWFREPKEGAEGDDLAWHVTQQIAGPVLGIGVQAARGLSMMSDGDYQRGAETMMPKAAKDLMKTYRQFSEGERTRKGDVIIDDVSAFNLAMQAMGFSNAEMAKVYDAREYIKGKEGRIEDERSKLMSDYFMARKDGDEEAMADVMAQIREFNASHYRTEAITSRTLRQSLKSKQRSAHRTQGGVYLSRNREYLRSEGAFVGDDGTATN